MAHIRENAVSSALLHCCPRPHRQYLEVDQPTLLRVRRHAVHGRILGWAGIWIAPRVRSNAASSSRLVVPVFDMDW